MNLNFLKKRKKKKTSANYIFCLEKCPQKKGVVRKLRIDSPRKPNSAKRRIAKVELSTKRFVLAKVRGQGSSLIVFSHVLVSGGRANDVPGVRYMCIKGVLDFSWHEFPKKKKKEGSSLRLESSANSKIRKKARSKYGIPKDVVF